jgi:hypothetical protein
MLHRSVLICAIWLIAGAALAQPAPTGSSPAKPQPPDVGEVVVQGHEPMTPKSFADAVGKFVHDEGRPGPLGQISRWAKPVCPVAEGLTPALDDFVAKRIEDVATRVGVPGQGDCQDGADVLVVFTTEPDQLMADVRNHHETLLGFHYVGETRSLAAFEPPMKSWYVTMTVAPGFTNVDSANGRLLPNYGASHFPPPMKSELVFVLVVVDSNLLEGQAIGPVADKIAMLALSKPATRDGCSSLPSIMDLLDPKCPSGASAEGLSTYDEAYLKALYAYHSSEIMYFERQAIRKRMVDDAGPVATPGPGH